MRTVLACLFVLTACGDDDRAPIDAGSGADTGLDATTSDADVVEDADVSDADTRDADAIDAGETFSDAGTDAGADSDAGTDAGTTDAGTTDAGTTDAGATRRSVLPSYCPTTLTEPGLYRGTLASNTNDVSSACGVTAVGGDGSLRVAVPAGATLRAVYTHAGDGVIYLLDTCPVLGSCLGTGRDASSSGAETLEWTNTSGATNEVFLYLDSFELGGAQTFELDLFVE
jgi:hypothetical protein